MADKKILLVEDDRDLGEMMKIKFNQAGLDIDVIQTGSEALNYFNRFTPDFIIMDIILPDIDGLTILNEISKKVETKNIPTIILSNVADDGALEQAKAIGKYEYLVKAKTDLNELVDKIKRQLNQ